MSKAVLIAIRPKWCELIAGNFKSIEVRKNRPKLETPFKCYIYCTLSGSKEFFEEACRGDVASWNRSKMSYKKGHVIGEFVCDSIFPLSFYASDASFFDTEPPFPVPGTCLTDKEIVEYLGNGKTGYGWHISELKIYDKAKELGEFVNGKSVFTFDKNGKIVYSGIKRPPQSWMYVEEMEEDL